MSNEKTCIYKADQLEKRLTCISEEINSPTNKYKKLVRCGPATAGAESGDSCYDYVPSLVSPSRSPIPFRWGWCHGSSPLPFPRGHALF